MKTSPPAKVYLIGAGPGDVELLTLKAVRCIGQADVILIDSLANPEVLKFARADVEVINVGKRAGGVSTSQEWIERRMIDLAKQGRIVARVKGGDPLIFARGGEELEALAAAGIPVEIVSGITSGIGVPASLGIPLTHRDHSHQLLFITGHGFGQGQEDQSPGVDRHSLPPMDTFNGTIIVYMGMNKAGTIVETLLRRGMPRTMPIAAISHGTTEQQRFLFAEADDFARSFAEAKMASPVLLVIGEVVRLSPYYCEEVSPAATATVSAAPTATRSGR